MKSWQDRTIRLRFCGVQPNKRLKLAGPAFKGSGRLCTSRHIQQHWALAPAGARPAA